MRSETTLRIPLDHPAFAGHFPGNPIVPGVILLDAAVHAMQQLTGHAGACEVGAAKFLRPVGPGETLTIVLETAAPTGSVRFEISSAGRRVATGTLAAAAVP
jgi:3-hydroxyacyl-[acyl-carrier-protein] dehydratase